MPEHAPYARTPHLWQYALAAVTGTATLSGYYVDSTGLQVGPAFSYAITTPTTLTALAGGTLPVGAVGAICALATNALWVGRGGQVGGAITSGQTPSAGYPQLAVGTYLTFGQVI